MSRDFDAVAAVAMIAMGLAGGSLRRAPKANDEEAEKRLAQLDAEHEERMARYKARREAEERAVIERDRMMRAGIEPTTGHPMSRQRKRALLRQGFKFTGASA